MFSSGHHQALALWTLISDYFWPLQYFLFPFIEHLAKNLTLFSLGKDSGSPPKSARMSLGCHLRVSIEALTKTLSQ